MAKNSFLMLWEMTDVLLEIIQRTWRDWKKLIEAEVEVRVGSKEREPIVIRRRSDGRVKEILEKYNW